MPSNNAAYLIGPKRPLQVRPAPYPVPGASEILIRTHAVAINPLEWLKVDMGSFLYSHIKYPFIFGTDCAGEVVSVGPDVTRFKTGDRVLGCAQGMDEKFNRSDMGAFQNYTVLLEYMTAPIPDGMTYESASVLPLGLSTAACGLFQEDQLGLPLPSLSPKPSGKTLLVWGGATSVGSNAIQLAVAAGCEVFTSCSPRNFTYVRNLGASQAFDYSSPTVVADILRAFEGKTTAGAFTVGSGSADLAFEIISKCTGNKFISMADYPVPRPLPEFLTIPRVIWGFASWNVKWWVKTKLHGVKGNFIFGSTLVFNGLGKSMFEDFLPMALAKGVYVAAPEPIVVGKGLEAIAEGLNIQRRGVSAKKVVVSL